jgi:hypothetical protein
MRYVSTACVSTLGVGGMVSPPVVHAVNSAKAKHDKRMLRTSFISAAPLAENVT